MAGNIPFPQYTPHIECMLSRSVMSRVFATPRTAACQAPLSTEFFPARILDWVVISSSRGSSQPSDQTHISCISCIGRQVLYHQCRLGSPYTNLCAQLLSHVQLCEAHGLGPTTLLCPWNFPGKNSGVGCHFLLQNIDLYMN